MSRRQSRSPGRRTRRTRRKRIQTADPGVPATAGDHPTPYELALDARDVQEFRATNVNSLVEQAAIEMKQRGIVDEIGALRIVLARLVNEEDDVQNLTKQVTQGVGAPLAAAKTQRLIDGDPIDAIAPVLQQMVDEIEAARKAANAEGTTDDFLN